MKKIFWMLMCTAALYSACTPGDFGATNVDPNQVSQSASKSLLTSVLTSIPALITGPTTAISDIQYVSKGPYPGEYGSFNVDWKATYIGPLANLQAIIDKNNNNDPSADITNGSTANQLAVARILKSYFFWWLTDCYGDIPYSEAVKGELDFTPKYDDQKDIYYDLFKELKEAAAEINLNEAGVKGDILLNGNMARWKLFANTTRMMLALRLIKNDFEKGKTEFNEAVAAGILESNDDNIVYQFLPSDPNNQNPWFNNYITSNRNDYAISNTLTEYMAPKNDPRLLVFGENLNGQVTGLPYGNATPTLIPGSYSRIGDFFRDAGSPAPVYTYAQALFALAEAAKVGYISGGDGIAETHYLEGIKASMQYYGVLTDEVYNDYLTQTGVAYNAGLGLEQIMSEKWVHNYLNGFEAWSDWRRTGFPALTPAENGSVSEIPRRYGYPTAEPTINADNYAEAINRQGPNDQLTRIWWDK